MQKTPRYLAMLDVAERLGLSVNTLRGYSRKKMLPTPDVIVGTGPTAVRGWSPETIDTWQANRPGKGGRPPKKAA